MHAVSPANIIAFTTHSILNGSEKKESTFYLWFRDAP